MMHIQKKIRVLVIDDSVFFQDALARGLALDPAIEVVGTASDPYVARDKILELNPDVLTLDIEMPKMNGIDFLTKLMPQYPIPVVMVSSVNDKVFDALRAGAVEFVVKPAPSAGRSVEAFIRELLVKVKIASTVNVSHLKAQHKFGSPKGSVSQTRIIAIGASTGGTEAIAYILNRLPQDMPGIVVVQHMPPVFTRMYAERLATTCSLEVREAKSGDIIYPGRVLIAPGGYHMQIKKFGKEYRVDCSKGENVNGHCPSVDVLFKSVAVHVGGQAIGVILTGMGSDGAKGLLAMRQAGALTLGQNQESCVVYGMPRVSFEIGAVQEELALERIPQRLHQLARNSAVK